MKYVTYGGPIRLVIYDVDGVLTDGTLYVGADGEAMKGFSVRDGLAVALLRAHGIKTGILSGKSSPALDYRARELGFDFTVTGRIDKLSALRQILRDEGLKGEGVAYVGDDVVDLPLAGAVGVFYAPADAHRLVLDRADYVLASIGGRGVAREAAEHVLEAGGLSLTEAYKPLLEGWGRLNAAQ